MDSYKKENKDLKEKVNSLQIELTEREVSVKLSLQGCQGRSTCISLCFFVKHPTLFFLSIAVHLLSFSLSVAASSDSGTFLHPLRCLCLRLLNVCLRSVLILYLQSNLIDLKEHASSLASSGLKKDSKLKSLEIAIEQKKEECSKLETQLQKVSVYTSLKAKSLICIFVGYQFSQKFSPF